MWLQVSGYQLQHDSLWTGKEVYGPRTTTHSVQCPASTTGHRRAWREEEKQGKYTIPLLQHSYILQLLSALGTSWAWTGVRSLTLKTAVFQNTCSISPAPQRNTLYPVSHSERRYARISHVENCPLVCLEPGSHYCKSDGSYSKSQLPPPPASRLLRMWQASAYPK